MMNLGFGRLNATKGEEDEMNATAPHQDRNKTFGKEEIEFVLPSSDDEEELDLNQQQEDDEERKESLGIVS